MKSPSAAPLKVRLALPAQCTGFALCLLTGLPPAGALILGLTMTALLSNPSLALTAALAQQGIKLSIILLGFGLALGPVLSTGALYALPGLLSICAILAVGLILGRLLQLDKTISALVSGGTAICGGSAIAALTPVLGAEAKHTGPAMALVFLLNGAALVLFPWIGHSLHMSQEAFGLWSALAIHDTSSVVGAASSYGEQALALALPIKLTRALWIFPLCLLAPLFLRKSPAKAPTPWFLFGFLVASLIAYATPSYSSVWDSIAHFGKALLSAALFLTGCSISLPQIHALGWKPLAHATGLWVSASLSLLLLALYFYP